MDTLISLGTLAAWTLVGRRARGGLDTDTYFEVAAVVTTLILLGRYLEARAKARASGDAIRELLELGAKDAHVLRDGEEVLVPVARARGRRRLRRAARARRSRPTASSSRARRPSTSRC